MYPLNIFLFFFGLQAIKNSTKKCQRLYVYQANESFLCFPTNPQETKLEVWNQSSIKCFVIKPNSKKKKTTQVIPGLLDSLWGNNTSYDFHIDFLQFQGMVMCVLRVSEFR